MFSSWWGIIDAEMKVPTFGDPELWRVPSVNLGLWKDAAACFAYHQDLCLSKCCLPVSFNLIFSQSSSSISTLNQALTWDLMNYVSPWNDRHGWLGVKNYLLTSEDIFNYFVEVFISVWCSLFDSRGKKCSTISWAALPAVLLTTVFCRDCCQLCPLTVQVVCVFVSVWVSKWVCVWMCGCAYASVCMCVCVCKPILTSNVI